MDLKQFAGKNVFIQFKQGTGWYVAFASEDANAAPSPVQKAGPDGSALPVVTPFIQGVVDGHGHVLVDTGNGGSISVVIDGGSIFSVTVVVTPAKAPAVIVGSGAPQIVTPN